MVCSQVRESVIGFRVNDGALFDPANLVFVGLDPQEPASVFQHLKRLPVDDLSHTVGYGRNAVVKIHLSGGNVDSLMPLMVQPVAPCGE